MAEHEVGSAPRPLRVAIIGSGPSGFYAADALLRAENLTVAVDMFDRLPTPFGLVRGGVAPDHQKIKSVIRVYEKTAGDERFRFFGNVKLGADVAVDDLARCYDHVVFAVGNESDRQMGIPGEGLAGVDSATAFVGWYNGHPDYRELTFDLAGARRVAVVGNGNVAIDVARILARNPEELADTDIADYALAALRQSSVREVLILGRRGPAQAAFSPKEIQEIGELAGCDLVVEPREAELDEVSQRWLESDDAPRSAHRNVEYLATQAQKGEGNEPRKVRCRFLVAPVELLGKGGKLRAVKLERGVLEPDAHGVPRPRGTGEFDTEDVQLLFRAIGYRGVPIPGVPFDERAGIIPNVDGRVLDPKAKKPLPGRYVVGWAKRGPTGLIGTNSPDSKATVQAMLEDLRGARAAALAKDHRDAVVRLLRERKVDFVSYDDWRALDAHEVARGKAAGKVREKVTRVEEMMEVIRAARG
jgi:ferredoxin--NADP+ reductase